MSDDQKRLADALEELKDHNFMKIHESSIKFIYYNLLRGLAIGLGSVVGATLLVSILVAILAQIEFIPILGNYAHQVIEIIEKLQAVDGKLAFCNLAAIVEKTFNIMGLTKYCEVFDSVDSGVEKLS